MGMSAYFIFAGDNRQRLRDANPEKKIGEIAKLLGEEWKVLAAAKKKKYSAQADKAMAEYKENMDVHKKTAYYKKFKQNLAEWNEEWKEQANEQKAEKLAAKAKKQKNKK